MVKDQIRSSSIKTIQNHKAFKDNLMFWAQQFREIVFLDSSDYPQKYSSYDFVLAADALTSIQTDHHNAFDDLAQYQSQTKDWLFGYLSYDLKNDTEKLCSDNLDGLGFPELFFFRPKKLFLGKGNIVEIQYLKMCGDEIEKDFTEILNCQHGRSPGAESSRAETGNHPDIQERISKPDYLRKVREMLDHIHLGNIYEANFCMEFYAEGATINPVETYLKLISISLPPFGAYLKNNNHFAICASPERYLRKENSKLISQPIKGTSKRSMDHSDDEESKNQLLLSEKERSENIMIVDLVRNDLSRTAAKNSVVVEELLGAYTFPQVHHLISTVISELDPKYSAIDAIRTTFPMGSMTGAPKISAMNIIENLEETKRGLYSGAIGYFTAESDFDFNVVIRSILYNARKKYLSFSVGSAITAEAIPEAEYDECLVKAAAMRKVLTE